MSSFIQQLRDTANDRQWVEDHEAESMDRWFVLHPKAKTGNQLIQELRNKYGTS